MLHKFHGSQNIYKKEISCSRCYRLFYTITSSFPILSITTVSSYKTIACTLKALSPALLALSLYLKINCLGSLVTFYA